MASCARWGTDGEPAKLPPLRAVCEPSSAVAMLLGSNVSTNDTLDPRRLPARPPLLLAMPGLPGPSQSTDDEANASSTALLARRGPLPLSRLLEPRSEK